MTHPRNTKAATSIWDAIEANELRLDDIDDAKWDDLRFAATTINPPGLISDPDTDTNTGGLLFDKTGTEIVIFIGQMPHGYVEGTDLHPHLHWVQSENNLVAWSLEYMWYDNGDVYPGSFTTIATDTNVFTYTSGDLAQISTFPAIDGTGMGISSMLVMKLSRIGANDSYDQDALFFEFDMHYQKDQRGSDEEYVK
jgi:hypothetical protein